VGQRATAKRTGFSKKFKKIQKNSKKLKKTQKNSKKLKKIQKNSKKIQKPKIFLIYL
jgi:hypothetical protein